MSTRKLCKPHVLGTQKFANHHLKKDSMKKSVIIVGAGFAGICLAIQLKKAGYSEFQIYERAQDVGGVWRENVYPGAACDVPTPLYSYSFETGFPFSAAYAAQSEMLAYIKHCVKKYEIESHIRYGRDVTKATFDPIDAEWRIECKDESTARADIFISAIGIFNEPVIPEIPGQDSFAGSTIHSAQWDSSIPLAGKRIAVIGAGASAIQIVPEIAKIATHLFVIQRTPAYVMPRKPVNMQKPEEERRRIFYEFDEFASRRRSKELVKVSEQAFYKHLELSVPNKSLRQKLTPEFVFGCKRTLFSDDWYPALQRPNVTPFFSTIKEITANSIELSDGESIHVDTIIYATGFNPSAYLAGIQVLGREALLADVWKDGAEAHLGINVSGFPNFFIMYGPNTNVGGSIVHVHECQARYIIQCIQRMNEQKFRTLEVRPEVMRNYCDNLQKELNESVMNSNYCNSYTMNSSGRVVTNYPGTQTEYEKETMTPMFSDFIAT